MSNAISCIVALQPLELEDGLLDIPAFYMNKLAYPLAIREA